MTQILTAIQYLLRNVLMFALDRGAAIGMAWYIRDFEPLSHAGFEIIDVGQSTDSNPQTRIAASTKVAAALDVLCEHNPTYQRWLVRVARRIVISPDFPAQVGLIPSRRWVIVATKFAVTSPVEMIAAHIIRQATGARYLRAGLPTKHLHTARVESRAAAYVSAFVDEVPSARHLEDWAKAVARHASDKSALEKAQVAFDFERQELLSDILPSRMVTWLRRVRRGQVHRAASKNHQ